MDRPAWIVRAGGGGGRVEMCGVGRGGEGRGGQDSAQTSSAADPSGRQKHYWSHKIGKGKESGHHRIVTDVEVGALTWDTYNARGKRCTYPTTRSATTTAMRSVYLAVTCASYVAVTCASYVAVTWRLLSVLERPTRIRFFMGSLLQCSCWFLHVFVEHKLLQRLSLFPLPPPPPTPPLPSLWLPFRWTESCHR